MLQILQPSAHHASSGSFLHAWVHSTQEKGFKCATHTCPPHLQAIMWGTPAQMWTEEKDAPLGGILALLQSLSSYLQGSSSSLSSKNNTSDRRCGQSLPSSPARGVAGGQQGSSGAVPVSLPHLSTKPGHTKCYIKLEPRLFFSVFVIQAPNSL